jgi:hypothetical protein
MFRVYFWKAGHRTQRADFPHCALADKTSRLRPRHVVSKPGQTHEPESQLLSETNFFADDAFDALSMAILNEPRWEEATKIEIERQCNGTSLL